MSVHCSDEDAREAWEVVRRSPSRNAAAATSGIPRNTLLSRCQIAMKRFGLPDPQSDGAKSSFRASPIPDKARSIDELITHRIAESKRAREYEEAIKLITVKIDTPGPIGLMVFGDPHIDNPGCDFALLKSHLEIAAQRQEYVFAGNIGDLRDNWIGRLERLYAQTTVSAKETWRLVEWMMRDAGVRWTWLVRGNHDAWAGINDPLDWIVRGSGVGVDQDSGLRISFRHPNGIETRLHARHDFRGNSEYNPLHALKKETLYGRRDHVIVAGHRHIGADAGDVNGDGSVFRMVRVSGYKVSDSYRQTIGAQAKPMHPAAMIIVDPDQPDCSSSRVWVSPDVETGAEYLDWIRARYKSRSSARAKPAGKSAKIA